MIQITYSLGSTTEPNVTWGAYWNSLGELQSERSPKTSDLEVEPLIYSDSNETDVFDSGGCIRRITVSFKKIDTFTNLSTFVKALLTLINGAQTPPHYPLNYVSDSLGTIKVKIERIDPILTVTDGPCMLIYTLDMIESSTLG